MLEAGADLRTIQRACSHMQGRRPPKKLFKSSSYDACLRMAEGNSAIKAALITLSVELCAQNTPNQSGDAIENA